MPFGLQPGLVAWWAVQSVRVRAPVADRDAGARAQGAVLRHAGADRVREFGVQPLVGAHADADRDDDHPDARHDTYRGAAPAAHGEHDELHIEPERRGER